MQRALLLGMWWAFIVEPRDGLPQYVRKYTLLLHETVGLYTINGLLTGRPECGGSKKSEGGGFEVEAPLGV